jgi:K+-transporting ATPase KdpF subunit
VFAGGVLLDVLSLVVGLALLGYLVYALLRPDRF